MTMPVAPVRRLPIWLSLTVILLSLAGGGYLLYWYFFGGGSSGGEVVMLDRDPNDSVRASANSWIVNSGAASLTITNPKKPSFELVFRRLDGLNSEEVRQLAAIRRIANDRHVQETLSITAAQMQEIRDIRNGASVKLTDADLAALSSAFARYRAAGTGDAKAKDIADTQLIDAVEAVAKPHWEEANRSGMERAKRAATLLTPEQWSAYAQFGK